LTEQAERWTKRLRLTMLIALAFLLGFLGYGAYLFIQVLTGSVGFFVAWLLFFGTLVGVVGSIKLGRRSAENLKGIAKALEIIAEDTKKL
jgi:ABC-type multidrug transport system fused ATPase/permease subunit